MSKTIVHIGFPRTASTWFQTIFFPKVENYTYVERKIVQDKLIHPSPLYFNPKEFLNSSPPNTNLLISEEMIVGRMRGGEVNHWFFKEYVERLKTCFPEAHYVLFLRNQKTLIHSLYNLYVQKGGTFSLSKFIQADTQLHKQYLFSPEFLQYDLYLDLLLKEVGRNRIHVFLYEDFITDPELFLEKLNVELGFKVVLEKLNHTIENNSYGKVAIALKRQLNKFTRHGIPFKHYYFHLPGVYSLKLTARKKHNTTVLPKKTPNMCHKYIASNEKVMKLFSLENMKKFEYPLP